MNTHAPKRIPCVTFDITDLHQRSSSGVLSLGFSQITQGAGFTARRCPVAPPKRGPDPAPRRALRLDDPLVATPLIAGSERTHLLDERAFDPMHESAVFAWSSVHDRGWSALSRGRRLPTGDGRGSSHVGVPDGYEHHRKQHSPPAAPRRASLLVLVFCPNDAATASMQRAMPCTRSGQARRWVRSDQLVREDRHAEEDPGVAGSEVAVEPAQKTPLISASRVLPFGRARWWARWVTPNSARRRVGSCRRQSWATAAGRWCGRPRGRLGPRAGRP
jgi:hypothetical protein